MRILFSSHVFAPSVGGLESVSQMLAEEFARRGHEVRLLTRTSGPSAPTPGYEVLRRPSARMLFGLVRWCEVFFHNNVSLPRAWPLLFVRRPWVVAHHVWIPRAGLAGRLKRATLRFATGISVSSAIAGDLPAASVVIPNPYDEATFRELPGVARTKDLIFVGRLVSDKGADLLVSALQILRGRGLDATATFVGSGPEEGGLRAQVQASGLAGRVTFAGLQRDHALARLLNEHRILVIPSRWQEPFGIVALEGIACGCVIVGSAGGGLPDAIGECGETFPNGDAGALADALQGLLLEPARRSALRLPAAAHLRKHARANVAEEYLRVFAGALESPAAPPPGRGVDHV